MATIKLKRSEVLQLSASIQILNKLSQDKSFPAKFNYALSKNLRKLKDEVEDSLAVDKKTLEAYEKKRIETLELYAIKDEAGKPKKVGNSYDLTDESKTLATEAVKNLEIEFKPALDESDKFMKEEIEIEIHQVPVSTVPDLPSIVFEGIADMVMDDPEPEK